VEDDGSTGVTGTTWQPLLSGTLAERASDAVHAIRASLSAFSHAGIRNDLAVGPAAGALFLAYATSGDEDLAEAARRCIEQAFERVTEQREPSLHRGFVGILWAALHLGYADPKECDHLVLGHLDTPIWRGHYNLSHGLVGLGTYALGRDRPVARRVLERVISHLDAGSTRLGSGIAWETPARWLTSAELRGAPRAGRFFNLGMSRGVAGVIAFLSDAILADAVPTRARPLLEGAIAWILDHDADASGSGFPYALSGAAPERARLAWCNGDLGIAVALTKAARALGSVPLNRKARDVARRAARRDLADSGVIDACLCHGAGGAGHVFNRLWQQTGDDVLRAAAELWFTRALDMRATTGQLGGFRSWERNAWLHGGPDGPKAWVDDPGLLAGAAGIGLGLVAATSTVEPVWDQVLLLGGATAAC
jgi:lantibiotic biosynthesis protein